MTKKLKGLLLLISLPALVVFYQNCGVKAPSVNAGLSSAGYTHSGSEVSCSVCHESIRPNSTVNFLSINSSAPFDYATHAAGIDCVFCHTAASGFDTPANWATGFYNHVTPAATTCKSCHSTQMPSVAVGPNNYTNGLTFTHPTNVDCSGCHQKSLSTAFNNFSTSGSPVYGNTDWQGGISVPPKPIDYSGSDFPLLEYTPSWSLTTLTFSATPTATIIMSMNHTLAATTVPTATMDNCAQCHAGASAGNYKPGYFHRSLAANAQPSTCIECHTSANNNIPVGFVGPVNSTSRNPASPEMNHQAVAWLKNSAGTYTQSGPALVSTDCVGCHQVPSAAPASGNGWNVPLTTVSSNGPTAYYHPSLGANQPTSCLDCHANSLPTGLMPVTATSTTLTKFDHKSDPNGSGDCIICHAPPTTLAQVQATGTSAWAGGVYHNSATKGSISGNCNNCHESQRPNGATFVTANGNSNPFSTAVYLATKQPFDLTATATSTAHGNARSCDVCHFVSAYTSVTNWANGNYNHAQEYTNKTVGGAYYSCQSCHTSQRPAVAVGPNKYTTGTFDHTSSGQGDCIGCHMATVTGATVNGVVVAGGTYANYLTTATPVNTWGDTDWGGGQGMILNALMGPNPQGTKTTITPATQAINSTTTPPLPLGQIVVSNPSVPPLYDQMLHNTPQITNAGLTIPSSTTPSSVACAACHKSYPTLIPGVFHKATGVNNAGLTGCADCHSTTVPIDIVGADHTKDPMNHSANLSNAKTAVGSLDCFYCHTNTRAGTDFTGAHFHASLQNNLAANIMPTNCTTCHFTTVPAGTGAPVTNYTAANLYVTGMMHTSSSVSGDCTACHAFTTNLQIVNTINASTAIPTSWNNVANPGFAYFHKNIPPTAITKCTDCHTTKPSAITVSANDSQHMNHNSTGFPADCVSCHKGDLTQGATPPALSTSWKNTDQFHTNVSTPASCKDCHGLGNGSTVAGTGNDLPGPGNATYNANLEPSTTVTTSLVTYSTSPVYAYVDHTEADVAAVDCNACHTTAGMTGNKWKDAKFHVKYSSKSSITGACATCHANERPPNGVVADAATPTPHSIPDHNPAVSGAIFNNDCGSCHTNIYGTGTASAPNWLGASGGIPPTITFPIPTGTNWKGTVKLTVPHPLNVTTSTTHAIAANECYLCHGGTAAAPTITTTIVAWDHQTFPTTTDAQANNCGWCHFKGQGVVSGTLGITMVDNTHQNNNKSTFSSNSPNYGQSCVNCHTHQNAVGPTWNGTTWPNMVQNNCPSNSQPPGCWKSN